MKHAEWFDSLADNWDIIATEEKLNNLHQLLNSLAISPASRVLDVGTGTGVLVPWLHNIVGAGGEIVGIDFAPKMIDQARDKFGDKALFLVADVSSWI